MDGWSNMFVRLINFSLYPIRGDRKIRRSFANNIYPPLTKRKEREKRRIQFPSILLSFHEKLWSFFRLSSLWTFHRTYVTSLSTNVRILNRRTQTCTKKTRRNNIKKRGEKRYIPARRRVKFIFPRKKGNPFAFDRLLLHPQRRERKILLA